MQRRPRSILSFFQKPSPESESNTGAAPSDVLPSSSSSSLPRHAAKQQNGSSASDVPANVHLPPLLEIRGTDTPPEKPPRPSIPARFPSGGSGDCDARPFASIMYKFAKEVKPETSATGILGCHGLFSTYSKPDKTDRTGDGVVKHETPFCDPMKISTTNVSTDNDNKNSRALLSHLELDTNILGPETPLRPFVPRLKRIQEEAHHVNDKHNSLLLESNKKMKLIRESEPKKETAVGALEPEASKFEWLNPSLIRDANGRRPGDPLYDRRTLYIPPDALAKMSASQKQYWSVKCQYLDVVLFFKVGKFYELYELDAEIGQKELDWKMTHSGVGKCLQVGISESGIEDAIQKLLSRGYKVGRMEQIETSDQAKARGASSVIQRKLVHVFTPSTMTDGCVGPDAVHLLALKEGNSISKNGTTAYGFAFVDCASLKFWVGSIDDDASCAALGTLLMQVSPKEILHENGLSIDAQKALRKYSSTGSGPTQLTPAAPGINFLDASEIRRSIDSKGYFRRSSMSWSSVVDSEMHWDFATCALGMLVDHLSRLMLDDLLHNGDVLPYHVYRSCLRMDGQTLVNLEIFSNNVNSGTSGTLYKHLDHCMNSSGKRLLRKWICHPLKNIEEINDRLNVVEGLIKNPGLVSIISEYLRRLPDLERLLGRVKASVGSSSTLLLPLVGEKILKRRVKSFGYLVRGLRIGLDLLRILQSEGHQVLSLSKVLNCPMIGELEVFLREFEAAMDDNFPHYQDLDVKDSDAEKLPVLVELFIERITEWSQVIHALNSVDVLQSFAITASISSGSMSRPVLLPASSSMSSSQETNGPVLEIKGLWHPYAVGENGGGLVPNDIYLGGNSTRQHQCALLLTGPNMGGKSTLLRATCLATVMAQLGSYVPCNTCVLSMVDVIFTRLGAMDRIMSGESTFFVECSETASVLHNATQDSLVLLDELGRGTSTFDGYAIAYAVLRHLVEKISCRLLFATHYHSLTKEFSSHPHVNLQHMACIFRPRNLSSFDEVKDLIFLYQLASGACPESYGLQVALMAGIPHPVVEAASKASQRMKVLVRENFMSSEGRSEFSTLHEEWLKALVVVSSACDSDEDATDTLLCLWHELTTFYRQQGK
uniref:DNA mismatch repair protein Msh6-2 n=1 Tax=Anthurium amnicola TaxID=1678845 RepID=A0A1D1YCK8_9ARAE